jgi:hypothetical protein
MINVHKEYRQAFLLEPTKLLRLIDKIHERLEDHHGTTLHDTFEVFLSGDRREELTSLTQVLALDNSRKHKIKRLVVTCSASSPGAPRPEHEVQVDFARLQPTGTFSVAFLASPFVSLQIQSPQALDWWLNASDMDHIAGMLDRRQTLTDEELREVSTMQLRNLLAGRRAKPQSQENQTRRTLFLAVPLSVVVLCTAILRTTCYPSVVFLWGDEVERYESRVQRRKTMWGIIISVTVVGVASRFFFENVSSLVSR